MKGRPLAGTKNTTPPGYPKPHSTKLSGLSEGGGTLTVFLLALC